MAFILTCFSPVTRWWHSVNLPNFLTYEQLLSFRSIKSRIWTEAAMKRRLKRLARLSLTWVATSWMSFSKTHSGKRTTGALLWSLKLNRWARQRLLLIINSNYIGSNFSHEKSCTAMTAAWSSELQFSWKFWNFTAPSVDCCARYVKQSHEIFYFAVRVFWKPSRQVFVFF